MDVHHCDGVEVEIDVEVEVEVCTHANKLIAQALTMHAPHTRPGACYSLHTALKQTHAHPVYSTHHSVDTMVLPGGVLHDQPSDDAFVP
jgi:hypothetical protein